MTALNSEGLEKAVAQAIFDPGATEGYKGDRTLTEWQVQAVMRAITSHTPALPPVDGLEVVAFRHPESDWAHVQYSEIDMHCRKDGPRPIPLVTLSQASSVIAGLKARVAELEKALTKIDAIRNSIIGFQKVGWSDHVYPLVAALEEAGFSGKGYDVMRAEIRTMLAAEARISSLEEENKRLREALAFYRDGFSFKTNKRYGGLEWHPTEALLDDCGNAARQALEDHNG